ncbi:MAG: tRNA (adenosine(37)-N6)-dimethylallyltransferase MiaA [Bacteroidales bacterium]|nr:tRNA (adenosine(37)-N6)-dimethylallyltransferase MiaA [Bacteroidales bacterium]
MPRLKHSIIAELPEPEQLDLVQLGRDYADGLYDLIVVLGPTASGKTRYAVRLAEALGGEILSADSRQVYRGMDIGTGKDLAEYGNIPYHLIDIADPGTQYNVWQFQRDFARAWADIRQRGAVPVLCGGTGMYINAVTRGYNFSEKTPLSAAREGNGERTDLPQRSFFIGTLVDRDTRNARIDARLDARLEEGMIDEIRGLLESGVSAEALISYGLEYKFVTLYLQGELPYADMREKLAIAIHQFAKRQMTWFRGMERSGARIHWVKV